MGKRAAITGGSAGIGKALALAFAKEGWQVAICGRNPQRLESAAAEIRENVPGGVCLTFKADVTQPQELTDFARKTAETFGGLEVWINNAGLDTPDLVPCREVTEELWDRLLAVNLKGVFFGAQAAAQIMAGQGGLILNISSFASLIPTAGRAVYSCAKAGVNNLTKTLAAELAPEGIRVVALIPGYIRTEMTAEGIRTRYEELVGAISWGRLGETEDLTGTALFLASPAARYITGTSVEVSGGKFTVQNPLWSWRQRELS